MKIINTCSTRRLWSLTLTIVTILATIFIAPIKANATTYDGGYAITINQRTVYKDEACTIYKGKLFACESFTVIERLSNNTVYKVEYSTSNGAKDGYIRVDDAISDRSYNSCIAIMNGNTDVYYGNNRNTYLKSGSVSAGERVVIVCRDSVWSFIEYNTLKGRKRGYVLNSSLTAYNPPQYSETPNFGPRAIEPTERTISKYCVVYGGPSRQYAQIGSVSTKDSKPEQVILRGIHFCGDEAAYFIEYSVTGSSQKKCGYIMDGDLA